MAKMDGDKWYLCASRREAMDAARDAGFQLITYGKHIKGKGTPWSPLTEFAKGRRDVSWKDGGVLWAVAGNRVLRVTGMLYLGYDHNKPSKRQKT